MIHINWEITAPLVINAIVAFSAARYGVLLQSRISQPQESPNLQKSKRTTQRVLDVLMGISSPFIISPIAIGVQFWFLRRIARIEGEVFYVAVSTVSYAIGNIFFSFAMILLALSNRTFLKRTAETESAIADLKLEIKALRSKEDLLLTTIAENAPHKLAN